MSFGQRVLEREKAGDPAESMWFAFDQEYRNSYVFAGGIFPRPPLPQTFFDSDIALKASSPVDLDRKAGLPEEAFVSSLQKFNDADAAGSDQDFDIGDGSSYGNTVDQQ